MGVPERARVQLFWRDERADRMAKASEETGGVPGASHQTKSEHRSLGVYGLEPGQGLLDIVGATTSRECSFPVYGGDIGKIGKHPDPMAGPSRGVNADECDHGQGFAQVM